MDDSLRPIKARPSDQPLPDSALKLPKGCAYLIDSNEAADNHLAYPLGPSAVVNLPVGDYSVMLASGVRLTDQVVVERKSFANLLGEITQGRSRFERALERLAEVKSPHLVIEASWREVLDGNYEHTKVHPNAVMGTVIAWCHRFRVPTWFVGTRGAGRQLTQWILARAAIDATA